jgi:hypothetical protein
MSEHITHIAVGEDSFRVVSQRPEFSSRIQEAVDAHPDAFRLGTCTRSGDTFILPLLTEWQSGWTGSTEQQRQLSYVIGWMGHLAGDRTFKPVFRMTDLAYYTRGYPGPAHASVYHDAATFAAVFDHGREAPFHPTVLSADLSAHPAAAFLPVSQLEPAMAVQFADALAGFKTFLPDKIEDWEKQWETIDNERQRFYVEVDRYTDAYHAPDPARTRQYLIDPGFYDPEDPIIQLARAVQRGEPLPVSVEAAVREADSQSLYAQSLKLGHDFMHACSEYLEGRIDLEQAKRDTRQFQAHKQSLDYYIQLAEQESGK